MTIRNCALNIGLWSLPSLERGLKLYKHKYGKSLIPSLPSRERGLKSRHRIFYLKALSSLPSLERGLKCDISAEPMGKLVVAPLAGAWIEIVYPPATR